MLSDKRGWTKGLKVFSVDDIERMEDVQGREGGFAGSRSVGQPQKLD